MKSMRLLPILWLALCAVLPAAELAFESTKKDVSAGADATRVDVDFPFTNASGQPVTITRFQSNCSCMTVAVQGGKQRYEPGESGVVRATFDVQNLSGEVERFAVLWLEGDPEDKPSVKLNVNFHIPEVVKVEPKTVKWEVGAKPEPQVIRITMQAGEPVHIKAVGGTGSAFKHELKTVVDGQEYELVLTPASTAAPVLGVFRMETDCKNERHRIKQVFAMVRKPAAGEPAAPAAKP